uniref:Secreted protein n=1 Tax=Ornithorhynchus anatinus TaxID=9258 RepID=A0A6I8PHZ2_ORNAN
MVRTFFFTFSTGCRSSPMPCRGGGGGWARPVPPEQEESWSGSTRLWGTAAVGKAIVRLLGLRVFWGGGGGQCVCVY